MNIDVRFRSLQASEALRRYAVMKVSERFKRFKQEIGAVVVRVGDVNGPRGGVDKRCQITATGPRLGVASLDEVHQSPYAAVDAAIKRLEHALDRRTQRARSAG